MNKKMCGACSVALVVAFVGAFMGNAKVRRAPNAAQEQIIAQQCLRVQEVALNGVAIKQISNIETFKEELSQSYSLTPLELSDGILRAVGYEDSVISGMAEAERMRALDYTSVTVSTSYAISSDNDSYSIVTPEAMVEKLKEGGELTKEGVELVREYDPSFVGIQPLSLNDVYTDVTSSDGYMRIITIAATTRITVPGKSVYQVSCNFNWLKVPINQKTDLAVIACNGIYLSESLTGFYKAAQVVRKNNKYVTEFGIQYSIDPYGNVTDNAQQGGDNDMSYDFSNAMPKDGVSALGLKVGIFEYPKSANYPTPTYTYEPTMLTHFSALFVLDPGATGIAQGAYGHVWWFNWITFAINVITEVTLGFSIDFSNAGDKYYGEPVTFFA